MNKSKIIVIPGGDTQEYSQNKYRISPKIARLPGISHVINGICKNRVQWILDLERKIGDSFEVNVLNMPHRHFADYDEWVDAFEQQISDISSQMHLIGFSLGSLFLIKYLSENPDITDRIQQTLFVSTFYNTNGLGTPGKFNFEEISLQNLDAEFQKKMLFFHSKDDNIIPYEHMSEYEKQLPEAQFYSFEKAGHFDKNSYLSIPRKDQFPEIVEKIIAHQYQGSKNIEEALA